MNFLKNLFSNKAEDAPAWDVIPADQRPAPRRRESAEPPEPAEPAKVEENPFLDEAYGRFELEDGAEDHANPYSSQTWEVSVESDSRKLRALQLGRKTEKPKPDDFNPYDTGVFKRGWK